MQTKKFRVHLNMQDPHGKPIEAELTVSTKNGVIQCACLKQIKTWIHDEEIALSN